MRIDATAATHPIIRKIATVDEIGEAFDTITYQKGQAVIGMLEGVVGPDKFREGVRRYMAKYKYGNTVTDQLWAEVAASSGMQVADFMHDFTLQGGVPLVSVASATCTGGRTAASFSQSRFGLDAASKAPQQWRVPVTMTVLGGGSAALTVRGGTTQPASVDGCGTLVVNNGKVGYYRVRYDAPGHAAIVRHFTKLSVGDQIGTIGDDFALAYSGDQDLARWTETLDAVNADADPLLLATVAGQLGRLTELYAGTPLGDRIKARSLAKLSPVYQRVGLLPRADDTPLVTNLREGLVAMLGAAGDADIVAAARRYVTALAGQGTPIPAAIRRPMLRTFAANASAADWDLLLDMARKETSPVVRNGYIDLLGAAQDRALAARALALVKAGEFTPPQRASLLSSVAVGHPELAFEFAVANDALVNSFLETSTRAGFVVQLGARSNDPAMPAKITAYAERTLPESSRAPAVRTVNTIANRAAFAKRLRPAVTAWTAR
jgi:aminopeptidase N